VITWRRTRADPRGLSWAKRRARLRQSGADVVGLNCTRGAASMLPLLVRYAKPSMPSRRLPLPIEPRAGTAAFHSLTDHGLSRLPGGHAFPIALDPFTCNRFDIAD